MSIRTKYKTIIGSDYLEANLVNLIENNTINRNKTATSYFLEAKVYACYFRPWQICKSFESVRSYYNTYYSGKGNIDPYRVIRNQIGKIRREYYGN